MSWEERIMVGGQVAVTPRFWVDGLRKYLLLHVYWLSLSLCFLTIEAASVLCLGDFPVATTPHPQVVPGMGYRAAQKPLREQALQVMKVWLASLRVTGLYDVVSSFI